MNTAVVAVSFDEMSRLAEAVAKSQLFGMKTPEQALSLMAIAQAEGVHPALAARDYHIVQNRPVLKSDAMLARFQASGGRMEMQEYTDSRVVAKFSHPQGGSVVVDWDIERAKRAGLATKDVWRSYPRNMLRARVISEGIRTVFPGATAGLYTPEEAADMTPQIERDITPPPEAPRSGVAALAAKLAPPPTEPAEDPTLLDLRSQAMLGTSALKAAWERLTPVHKKSLSAHLDSLKAAANEADEGYEPEAA